MEVALMLGGVGVAHLLAVISPGPSLLVVARTAVSSSRAAGAWVALGLGLGTLVWAVAALFGLGLLFAAAPWLYAGLRIGGALYLLYLAVMLWRHAGDPLPVGPGDSPAGTRPALGAAGAVRLGLLTQLSNPKVAVFFGSIFVALLPPVVPGWMAAALLVIVFANEVGWYLGVAVAFSTPRLRDGYARLKAWIDRATGSVLAALGLRLAADG